MCLEVVLPRAGGGGMSRQRDDGLAEWGSGQGAPRCAHARPGRALVAVGELQQARRGP